MRKNQKVTSEQVYFLYSEGLNNKEIAELLSVSPPTITRHLRKYGLVKKRGKPWVKYLEDGRLECACGFIGEKSEFLKGTTSGKRRYKKCRKCARNYFRKYMKKDWWKKYHRNFMRKLRKTKPQSILAREIAQGLKKDIKKDSCEVCGGTDFLEMHHPDYDKPEVVITLCRKHHNDIHYHKQRNAD